MEVEPEDTEQDRMHVVAAHGASSFTLSAADASRAPR
jgi:hypothetical protein